MQELTVASLLKKIHNHIIAQERYLLKANTV